MLLEWQFKLKRFGLQKKLNSTNLALYKSISLYIKNSGLRSIEKEEILQQIMDMMLQAQAENKPMNLIIGNNYEEFCKSIIKEYSSGKSLIYKIMNLVQRYLLWTLLASISIILFKSIFNLSLSSGITINQLLLVNVISLFILPISKRNRQETSYLTSLYARFYMMKRGLNKTEVYIFTVMIIVITLIRFFIGRAFGPEAFNYTITLYACMPYILISALIIGSIEVYKMIYDKR